MPEHPDLHEPGSKGSVWTWRGHGYAIVGQPDTDWKGRPWTTSAETLRREFGAKPVPVEPKMR